MSQKIRSLGIMNGTSLDAIDYVLIECSKDLKKINFIDHVQKALPSGLKKRLLLASQDMSTTYEISLLHFELGQLYAKHIKVLKKKWTWQVTGLHGQTIHHQGKKASWQIGHPGALSLLTGLPTFYDFRSADLVAGGQGAPFAPFFQNALRKNLKLKRCAFHNLGGISNVTYFDGDRVVAFDTGPANLLMDTWIKTIKNLNYDSHGRASSKGLAHPLIVNRFLDHPYFKKRPPKSTGRELFNTEFIKSQGGRRFEKLTFVDQMATLCEVTALSVARAYSKWCKDDLEIYFYGGGVYNDTLMKRLSFHLPKCRLRLTDEIGWPSQSFEGGLMAFLATARKLDKTVHIPSVTGAKRGVLLGSRYSL